MPAFAGQPAEIERFLGRVDEADPTNLPMGLSPLAQNVDFTSSSVRTRYGLQTAMQGKNASPITGFLSLAYTPETSAVADVFFRLHTFVDATGTLLYENPEGSGATTPIQGWLSAPPLIAPPAGHVVADDRHNMANNRGYLPFSDLTQPVGQALVLDLATKRLDPYGLKPFGMTWAASTPFLAGEVTTPMATGGNGHTYRCTQAGTTGTTEPMWPTAENGTVNDGGVVWEEYTAVMANRLPAPLAPTLTLVSGGSFPAGQDVYIALTAVNPQGETILGATAKITTTAAEQGVQVNVPAFPGWVSQVPLQFAVQAVNLYEADTETGNPQPSLGTMQLAFTVPVGAVGVVNETAVGVNPPSRNSARITNGMLQPPTTEAQLSRVANGGSLAVGLDVWVRLSYANAAGETTLGPSNSITDTDADDGVQIPIVAVTGYNVTATGVYVAAVATGTAEPDVTDYALLGFYSAGQTADISAVATGRPGPAVNTTGTVGNIAASSPTGGPFGGQGKRYAAIAFESFTGTISGFTLASVISYDVDEDGYELAFFNVTPGPANIQRRILALTIANGSQAGDFAYLGEPSALDGYTMTSTTIEDNLSTSTVVNFTDEALTAALTNAQALLTYKLQSTWPAPCVTLDYLPSVDRFAQSGVAGYYSGHLISRAGDVETYQADTMEVPIGSDDGQRAWRCVEFRSTIFSLREESGWEISPSTSEPSTWSASQRWSGSGPCGPRAVSISLEEIVYVHRNGIYRYTGTGDPEMVSGENPYWWNTINWGAATTIWCVLDEKERVLRCGFPVNGSLVPNQEYALNYRDGWGAPAGYSVYAGKDITGAGVRKVSINDVAANLGMRVKRTVPVPRPSLGPVEYPTTGGDYYLSQFLYGSSGPDGTVQAIVPGVFSDNGAGIRWRYETAAHAQSLSSSKPEGFNINCRGQGILRSQFIAGRKALNSASSEAPVVIQARDIVLSPMMDAGETRIVPSRVNERWRMGFEGNGQPDQWAEIMYVCMFIVPLFAGRAEDQR